MKCPFVDPSLPHFYNSQKAYFQRLETWVRPWSCLVYNWGVIWPGWWSPDSSDISQSSDTSEHSSKPYDILPSQILWKGQFSVDFHTIVIQEFTHVSILYVDFVQLAVSRPSLQWSSQLCAELCWAASECLVTAMPQATPASIPNNHLSNHQLFSPSKLTKIGYDLSRKLNCLDFLLSITMRYPKCDWPLTNKPGLWLDGWRHMSWILAPHWLADLSQLCWATAGDHTNTGSRENWKNQSFSN